MPLQRTQIQNHSDKCLDWPPGAKTTMLTNTAHLKGFVIRATDSELGIVDQIYFDDETWAIRYLIVETGGWLSGRRVLISPISVVHTDLQGKRASGIYGACPDRPGGDRLMHRSFRER